MPTISFDVTANQANRIQAAIGLYLGLGRDATASEVRQFIIARLRDAVHSAELTEAQKTITSQSLDIE